LLFTFNSPEPTPGQLRRCYGRPGHPRPHRIREWSCCLRSFPTLPTSDWRQLLGVLRLRRPQGGASKELYSILSVTAVTRLLLCRGDKSTKFATAARTVLVYCSNAWLLLLRYFSTANQKFPESGN
jgi:hypothetical protein